MGWQPPEDLGITTERLLLMPLVPDDAVELAEVLSDERLHHFIGGEPADAALLRSRYERMVAGTGRDDEHWLNWIVRRRTDGEALGTAEATLTRTEAGQDGEEWRAEVAWVVGVPWQSQGFASEAGRALVEWLGVLGIAPISANIHPEHRASEAVAVRAGLRLTDGWVDGERVWALGP